MTGIVVTLCGDILPVKPLVNVSSATSDVFDRIAASDFTLANFEMALTGRGSPVQKLLNIRAPASAIEGIDKLGLTAVTLANNHAPDYGWAGLFDTRQALQEHGIETLGLGSDAEEAAQLLLHDVQGCRIGVIAFSCLTPTGCGAASDRPGISALHVETAYEVDPWYQMEEPGDPSCIRIRTRVREGDLAGAVKRIQEARGQCDLLIATVHWGFGSTDALAEYQRPLAEALIEAGADVVHGHHPHAIQAFGHHRGKPIIFSANVLIGQQVFLDASPQVHALWAGMSSDGYVTRLHVIDGKVSEIEILPTSLNEDRLPEFVEGPALDRIHDRFLTLSAAHGTTVKRQGDRLFVAPAEPLCA